MSASTQDFVLLFPSQEIIIKRLQERLQTNTAKNRHLIDQKIIRAVAKAFANKVFYTIVVQMTVNLALRSINLDISAPAFGMISMDLTQALIDCAKGKLILENEDSEHSLIPLH